MDVLVTDFSLRLCNVHLSSGSSVGDLTQVLSRERGVPHADFYVKSNGRLVGEDEELLTGALYRLEPRLCGGKGGFGSMLRALGAQIEKTTNREACRDLSGRRLRDVNHEKEMAEWLKKQADREAEKEQRRIERLQRKLAEPKHYFNDPEYDKQCSELSERMEESIKKGLQASSSSGPSGASRKRPSPYGADPGKQKRMWMSGLDGVSSSEDESEGSDVEAAPSTSISPERRSAALGRAPAEGPSTSAALGRAPAETSSTSSSSSSSSSSSPQRSPAEPAGPVSDREAEPVAQNEAGPVAQMEAEPVSEREAEPVAEKEPEEAEPVAQMEAEPVAQNEAGPVAEKEPVAQMEAEPVAQMEAEPVAQMEAEPVAQMEAEPVAQMEAEPVAEKEPVAEREAEPMAEREAEPVAETHEAASGSSGSVETQQNIAPQTNSEETPQPENTATPPAETGPLDLQAAGSALELEALGMDRLKVELMERGLKCGGTLLERAARLFSVRGLAKDQIPAALLAKPSKGRKR